MTDFKIGDVVRLKTDGPDRLKLIVRDFDKHDGQILCRSECSQRIMWVSPYSCELVHRPDPQADLIQAIREVLLSDEFLKAFAAAFRSAQTILSHEPRYKIVNADELAFWQAAEPKTEAPNDPT